MNGKIIAAEISLFQMMGNDLPKVFMFNEASKNILEDAKAELVKEGKRILDINKNVAVTPEDYKISANEAGFRDDSGTITVDDFLVSDEQKRELITRVKLNRLESSVDHDTVLLINYNAGILNNRTLYETLRTWLKDGYRFNYSASSIPVAALVYLETEDRIRDFCYYGQVIID